MNVFGMSALILAGLTMMMSILLLAQTPEALRQAAALDFPLTAFDHQPMPPPVPLAVGAAVASLLAWKSRVGSYIIAANLVVLGLVLVLFT